MYKYYTPIYKHQSIMSLKLKLFIESINVTKHKHLARKLSN
jgi:hypothetical protein